MRIGFDDYMDMVADVYNAQYRNELGVKPYHKMENALAWIASDIMYGRRHGVFAAPVKPLIKHCDQFLKFSNWDKRAVRIAVRVLNEYALPTYIGGMYLPNESWADDILEEKFGPYLK